MTAAPCPPPRRCSPSSASATSRCCGLAQLISTAGSSLTDLAAGIYVFRVTGSALAVGLTLMVTAIPSLIVGLLAGVFVDRHDRKRILIVDLPGPGRHRRAHRVRHRHRRDRARRGCTCCCSQRRRQAVLRSGPRQPHPGDRQRRGARRRRTRSCRSPRSARPRSGSPAPACWPALDLHLAFIIDAAVVRGLRRAASR